MYNFNYLFYNYGLIILGSSFFLYTYNRTNKLKENDDKNMLSINQIKIETNDKLNNDYLTVEEKKNMLDVSDWDENWV